MHKSLYYFALVPLILSGCGDPGSTFLGEWVSVKNECSTMSITKNGDHYVVKTSSPGFLGLEKYSFPGTLHNGILHVSTSGERIAMMIDRETGEIMTPRVNYKKLQGEKKNCSKKR